MLKFALAGNPNCGKTTLFNQLTGSRAHVGNWCGVTVEGKEGICKIGDEEVVIVDLPGIYSLSPYSEEEVVSRDYILKEKPDLIIDIVDSTNIERNLYLTSQLMETGVPVIMALNMIDALEKLGDVLDIKKMKSWLGMEIVPIAASKNIGVDKLIKKAIEVAKNKNYISKTILSHTPVYDAAVKVREIAQQEYGDITMFSAIKLLERDEKTIDTLNLSQKAYEDIDKHIDHSIDWEIYVADLRYKYITNLVDKCIKRTRNPEALTTTDKIDLVITNKYLALPIFFVVMMLVFYITFGPLGSFMTDGLDYIVNDVILVKFNDLLVSMNVAQWLVGLIVDGIATGVGMVIVFLPQILLLFLFLSILEDTGYMARAAFIMDRLLRRFGLSGKSFVPMLMGFGCSVPAIMAARTLENERSRKMTIILIPFMSCGARMPVYAVIAGALFGRNAGFAIISLYVLGIAVALVSGLILKNTVLKGEAETFIMELPNYRMPSVKSVLLNVWDKAKEFIVKAFTILLVASVVIWFLQSFNIHLQMISDNSESLFADFGKLITPLFKPCGFGNDWRNSVSLLTGFVAKEAVVSTLGILYGEGSLAVHFTPLSAYSYLVFILLYMPCVVAFATTRKEMRSWKWTMFAVCYQTGMAWIVSTIVFQLGSLIL